MREMILLLGVFATAASDIPAASRPNILFIYTDDQAPRAVRAAGDERFVTPNIDRIFHEGAHLANSFVTTPVCSPSRVGLLASRYGTEMGITDWIRYRTERDLGVDPQIPTWPRLLAENGYYTALVGKWHLGTADRYHPKHLGYDEFIGIRGGGCPPENPSIELPHGQVQQVTGFTPDIFTEHAMRIIREHQQKPFLVSLHFRAPHAPWLPVPEEDRQPFQNLDLTIPNPDFPDLDVALVKQRTREYLASVKSIDRNVGKILTLLDELELSTQTIVIFTSDHGYNLGEHGVWFKGNAIRILTRNPAQQWANITPSRRPNLWDTSLQIPTAVRWPGSIKPGTIIEHTISNLDWFPTLLSMAGIALPPQVTVHGRDFTSLLRGQKIEWNDDLYLEYSMHHGATTHMRGYRTPRWKLVHDFAHPGRAELYDLAQDPHELTNLIQSANPHHARIRADLHGKIIERMRTLNDPALALVP